MHAIVGSGGSIVTTGLLRVEQNELSIKFDTITSWFSNYVSLIYELERS